MPIAPDALRAELLARVIEVFETTRSRRVRSAMFSGLSGIGKSSLAAGYIADRADLYDWIFWVSAQSEATLRAGFGEFTPPHPGFDVRLHEQLRAPAVGSHLPISAWKRSNCSEVFGHRLQDRQVYGRPSRVRASATRKLEVCTSSLSPPPPRGPGR